MNRDEIAEVHGRSITAAIPTLNEGHSIRRAIAHVLANEYPKELIEILIVDAGSTDDTVAICDSFRRQGVNVRVFTRPGCTVYEALNIALQQASGEFFMRVDARSYIPANYIRRCIANLDRPKVVATGGVQRQIGDSPFGRAVARVTSHWLGVGNASFRLGGTSGVVDTVYLGFYRTQSLRAVGGYDQVGRFLSEDASINAELRKRGGDIYLDGTLNVEYPAKETSRALIRQYLIYGAAKATYFVQRRTLTSVRQLIPIVVFSTGMGLVVLSFMDNRAAMVLAAALGGYLLLLVGVSIVVKGKARCTVAVKDLVVAFVVIHLAWPAGFYLRLLLGERALSTLLKK